MINIFPRSILLKIGYSKLGSTMVKILKKNSARTFFETENGIKMYLDMVNPQTWDLMLRKDPEKKIKELFLNNVELGNTVIDVGANIGEFSLIASKKVGEKGKVFSVEPLENNVLWVQKNLSLNNFKNCYVMKCAAGNKLETKILYKKNENATMGILDPSIEKENLVISSEIKVETIDNIINGKK